MQLGLLFEIQTEHPFEGEREAACQLDDREQVDPQQYLY